MISDAPRAIVKKPIGPTKETRNGRGFSKTELLEVGLSLVDARKRGLMVDPLRKTKHKENIKSLKEWLKKK